MALKENQEETPISENPNGDEEGGEESQADGVGDFEDEDEDEDEAEEEDEEEESRSEKSRESRLAEDGSKLESMFRRLASEKVKLRVHDVLIKGNTKTKDSLIEAELEAIKNATTMQEAATLQCVSRCVLLLRARELHAFSFRSSDFDPDTTLSPP